ACAATTPTGVKDMGLSPHLSTPAGGGRRSGRAEFTRESVLTLRKSSSACHKLSGTLKNMYVSPKQIHLAPAVPRLADCRLGIAGSRICPGREVGSRVYRHAAHDRQFLILVFSRAVAPVDRLIDEFVPEGLRTQSDHPG